MKKWSLASLLTLIVFLITAFFSPLVGAQDEQGLSLTKTADTTAASLGDTITYTYLIENTDNVTISSLELIDSELDVITLPTATLEAGATCNVTAQHTVLISDYESGFVLENLATIKGIRPDGSTATAEASASVKLLPYTAFLALEKVADPTTAALGDIITYTYTITNTGNVTVTSLKLVDDKLDIIPLPISSLEPGATCNVTAQYTVLISDYASGLVLENLATIKGTSPDSSVVAAQASASVELLEYAATLTLDKVADRASASPHETIKYTYTVTNTGNVTISDLSLVDSNLGTITLSPTWLEPGESISAEYDYEVTLADLPGPIINTAKVTGEDPLGNEVSYTTDPVSVSLTINKLIMTRAEILIRSGVPGKGIENAPGLQKTFNENSQAAEHAGKKDGNGNNNANKKNKKYKEEKGNNGKNGK